MQKFFSAALTIAVLLASGQSLAQSFGEHGRRGDGRPPGGYPGNPPSPPNPTYPPGGHPGHPGYPPAPNPGNPDFGRGPGDGGWHRRPRPPGHHYCQRAQYNFSQAQFALNIAINNLNNLHSLCGGNPGCIVAYQNLYNQAVTNYQNAQQEAYFACNRRRW